MYRTYKTDIFFATRIKIIGFHIVSVALTVAATVGLLEYVQRLTLLGVVESFNAMLSGATTTIGFVDVNQQVWDAKWFVLGSVVLLSVLFGFIATRLALNPVRDSLIVQRRFIASVAHELRTPLAILKTQNEVAKLDVEDTSPLRETLDQNVAEIDHITQLLNNLLLFSRVDTRESITFDMVDLGVIIETVVSRLQKLGNRKGVKVTYVPMVIPHVYGNEVGLEQMLFNLVKNGITYTPRGGEVVITCTAITEREVTLRVSDTGIGIADNELQHIFEPFYRTDSGQEQGAGTGLGLALVFEIMKLHGGKIRVASTPGVGTQFDVSIPRQPKPMTPTNRLREVGFGYDFSQPKTVKG